jgi:hypothetical protein
MSDTEVVQTPKAPELSPEVAKFLYNMLSDQTVRVGNPDAQAAVYMATRALSELQAVLEAQGS